MNKSICKAQLMLYVIFFDKSTVIINADFIEANMKLSW